MNSGYRALTPAAGIAGVDEAGRGPLAGPLVVAAVVLDPCRLPAGIDDSKRLTAGKRERLQAAIVEQALAWSVIVIEVEEIDRRNIHQATLQGMRRAVEALGGLAQQALIDGNRVPDGLTCPARAVVGGDALEPAIGAASILAKVHRDRLMRALHEQHPEYGFDRHMGYPTPEHLVALHRCGPCPQHRRSFAPVRAALAACPLQGRLL